MATTHDDIREQVKTRTSEELAVLLLLTEGLENSPETNLVKFAIGDELVTRYPHIRVALDAWSESLSDPRSSTDIIIESLPVNVLDGIPKIVQD